MADTAIQDNKVQSGVDDINQNFKERDVQKTAKKLNIPYVNLLTTPINPDYAQVITKLEAEESGAAIFFRSGKRVRLAISDPNNPKLEAVVNSLKEREFEVNVNLASEESVKSAHKIFYTEQYEQKKDIIDNQVVDKDLGSFVDEIQNLGDLQEKIEQSTFDEGLNYIQVGGYKTKASDVHFQPEKDFTSVRFRIDGVLKTIFKIKNKSYEGILKEIKFLSHLKLNLTEVPQDGQYSFTINDRGINVRVSILPTSHGETCVLRLLDSNKTFQEFESLGFEGEALRHVKESVKLPHGMILVTGPTGSGKTTTMYSMLQSVDTQSKKVITLEDPIEYSLENITQSQVDPDKDYDFADGLRAILRQDPDVIMIGEIRDLETAETATQASLTGHLVISTLHTNSAVESIPRLVNMGVKSFILAPALDLIIAQRLVRNVCSDCSEEATLEGKEKEILEKALSSIESKGIDTPSSPKTIKHAKGCDKCSQTGFVGQLAITEVLRFDDGLRNLILENAPMPKIYEYIEKDLKMLTLYEDGMLKVARGLTTLEEIIRVAA